MTQSSTTIRVTTEQRDQLRKLASDRSSTMTETLDAALDALRRDQFYRAMSDAEAALKSDQGAWGDYVVERNSWLGAELS